MGGAFGHLEHPYDVEDFTFNELALIVKKAFAGELEYVQEKTDGQNILVSWKDGKIIFARNKSHLKDAGSGAMDLETMIFKFDGRGTISEAFKFAGEDLHEALVTLTDKQRHKIFKEGKKFMSLEIMYGKNPNIILYDKDELRFHGTLEYNEKGELISQINKEDSRILAGMIKSTKAHKQKFFEIKDLKVPTLPKLPFYKLQAKEYVERIKDLQRNYDLKGTNHLHSYKNAFWDEIVKRHPVITDELRETLVLRWARGVKSPTISKIKKENPEHVDFIMQTESQHKILTKQMMQPFDRLFLEMGVTLMQDMTDLMVVDTDASIQHTKREMVQLEKLMMTHKDPVIVTKFIEEMERLESLGGVESFIPSEGITFMFKGKLLKLTGTFAPINQLLGLLRFER